MSDWRSLHNFLTGIARVVDITHIHDSKGYNALHLSVYKDSFRMTEMLCNFVHHQYEEQKLSQTQI